ncbi:MAG: Wzt carbohydrate-binding domain-containing protein, partial [Candidatus Binatia bacterium]
FHTVRLLKECGAISPLFIEREPMTIEVTLQVKIQASFIDLVCKILTTEGVVVFSIASNKFAVDLRPGLYTVAAPIKPNYLRPGKYRIHLSVQTRSAVKQDEIDDGIFFEIEHDTKGYDNPFWGGDRGVVRFDYQWGSLLLH